MSACPQCGTRAKPGQSICEKCDFIIDDSFLGDEAGMRSEAAPPDQRLRPKREMDPTLGSQALADTEEILDQSWREFQSMRPLDRWTLGAGLALFVFTALPWRDTPTGADLGVSLGAWPASLFGIAAAVIVYLRQTVLPVTWRRRAQDAQLALGGLSALVCIYRMIVDTNLQLIEARGQTVYTSTPSFGVFLALGASIAIAVSSFRAKRDAPG